MSFVMLNFRVEISVSDEVINAFSYAFGGRNQQKSPEAKEVYERLCLLNLDKRLKFLESSAADSQKVERVLNNFNKKIADIESNVETMIGHVYDSIETDNEKLNDKIEKLEKNFFKTELNSEVEKAVDDAVKKILATDLSAVIQEAVENTIKTANLVPDLNKKIQAEVNKAVRNIPPPNFDPMIQAAVNKAVRNIPPPNFDPMIQAEVNKAVRNIPPPNFDPMIQAAVAKAVKEELQKTQAGNVIYPSSYLSFEQQRQTINALKKLVDTQQKVIEELTTRLSAVEEKAATAPKLVDTQQKAIEELTTRLSAVEGKTVTAAVKPAAEEYTPLNIRDENSWLKYKSRLKDIGKLKLFAEKNPVEFKTLASKLKKIETAIEKITPDEFDEYTTETITDKTIEAVKEFIDVLDTCRRKIKNPSKDSTAAQELYTLIEEYLSRCGIRSMNFKAGDDYNTWADLSMSEMPMTEKTFDSRKHNSLKEVYVQPHYIEFINERDKKDRRVFGGRCVAYAYEDKR